MSFGYQYKTEEELQALKNIQNNLEEALQEHQQIEAGYMEVINRAPGCLARLTQQIVRVMDKLDTATMAIDKFRNKVIFKTNEQHLVPATPKQNHEQNRGIQGPNKVPAVLGAETVNMIPNNYQMYEPLIYPQKYPKVGEFEQAVIEQIECVDAQMNVNQSENYERFNEMLANRIFYSNEAVDLCLRNLIKKL